MEEFERREPVKRAHRHIIGSTKVNGKLLLKVGQRVKMVGIVETSLIFPVATLDFTVMPWCVRTDKLVPNM